MGIFFLGGGNMAAAVIAGLTRSDTAEREHIFVTGRNAARNADLAERYGVAVGSTLPALSADDVLVLAVKPQDMRPALSGVETNGALVLSVAAGLTVGTLAGWLGTRRIVRVMPNTPAQVGLGVAGLFAAADVAEADRYRAERIMAASGLTVWLDDEAQMHGLTAVSGCGPAYVFYLLAALQQAAVAQGFDAATARTLSLATFEGAVALAAQSGEPFDVLQSKVASKGGTTAAALETFRRLSLAEHLQQGVASAAARSEEMAAGG